MSQVLEARPGVAEEPRGCAGQVKSAEVKRAGVHASAPDDFDEQDTVLHESNERAAPGTPPDLFGDRVAAMEAECGEAEKDYLASKERTHDFKTIYDDKVASMRAYIRSRNEKLPLFDSNGHAK